jgi:hypothetical protein
LACAWFEAWFYGAVLLDSASVVAYVEIILIVEHIFAELADVLVPVFLFPPVAHVAPVVAVPGRILPLKRWQVKDLHARMKF